MLNKTTCLFLVFVLSSFFCPAKVSIAAHVSPESPPILLSKIVNDLLIGKNGLSGAQILEKGEESLLSRAWLTDHAEKTIDIQYFIWSSDNIGILAADFLLRAAGRGVQVRVIVDDLLIDAPDRIMLALAKHPNIHIKIYNPKHSVGVSKPRRLYNMLTDFRSFNQRMHDKTMIVDQSVAITGGRNMADEYFDYDQEYNFRDRDVFLVGPVVGELGRNFTTFWESSLSVSVEEILLEADDLGLERVQEIYNELHAYAADPENFIDTARSALRNLPRKFSVLINALVWDHIEFIHDVPGKNSGKHGFGGGGQTTRRLLQILEGAKERVVIQSPYLILPDGGLDFFARLVARGVEVRIITNSLAATDNLQAFSGYMKQRKEILKAGIQVYEFKPQPMVQKELMERLAVLKQSVPVFAIHAKSMVVDSRILYVGTFNLDPRSVNLNTEVGVLMDNKLLASQVEAAILTDMLPENSWETVRGNPDDHASLGKRLKVMFWGFFPLEPLL